MRKKRRKEFVFPLPRFFASSRLLPHHETSMDKGFTLIELVLTVIVLSILSAFTFSVIWQYSNFYAATRGGFIYSEAAAALERITRELKDAEAVDWDVTGGIIHRYITFQLTHGTPSNWTGSPAAPPNPPHWVQYCIASVATPGVGAGITAAKLWRVEFNNNTPPYGDQCASGDPVVGGSISSVALMSGNLMSMHANAANTSMGLQVMAYWPGSGIGDNYEIKLALTADRTRLNLWDGAQYSTNPSVTLVSRVTPRNCPFNAPCSTGGTDLGAGSDRAFSQNYYDEIK